MNNETSLNIQMLLVAILAWAVENDEPFNVSPEIVQNILDSMVVTDSDLEIVWDDDSSDRLKIGVRLVNGKVPEEYENNGIE